MAKISPVSIKYIIHATFEANGALEKPDVIGAIFGQTEGLLGEDLEMRELQKEGKIGRIDVEVESDNGKTTGKIEVPSSLDKAETTILAAAIETIERMGPSDSKIEIESIEDVRANKRNFIVERAKELLGNIEGSADSREMERAVKTSARESKLQEYGKDKLPAGDISDKEVIVVEGRADVLNLLRNGVNNVIAMNGTILPETVQELSKEKEITLFVDGDRGGDLIIKNVSDNAEIDYVVKAPDGKEVEELSGKEILTCLRKKSPIDEVVKKNKKRRGSKNRSRKSEEKEVKELTSDNKEKLREMMKEIEGSKDVLVLDSNLKQIKKAKINRMVSTLRHMKESPYIIMVGGKATSTVIRVAEDVNAGYLAAKNFTKHSSNVKLVSL